MNRKARVARCYTEQSLSTHSEIELDKRSSHHLSTVLRSRPGTPVELFNGDGNHYSGEITATGKKTSVLLTEVSPGQLESSLQITLVQAIARGDKMDGIVQKATELGVNAIQPIYSRHSITTLDGKRERRKCDHWQAIAISACEQCGRCVLPTVHAPVALQHYLSHLHPSAVHEARWILSPVAQQSNMTTTQPSSAHLLIGPESGFDADELLASKVAGFSELQLGPRVLRTETAGPAAIAILQARFGDIG